MRIRKSASRLLGSAYSASAAPAVDAAPPRLDDQLPPPPHPAPCSAPESSGGPGFSRPSASSAEPCVLSRSPWDLIADLSISDQKEEDELVDKYFVHVKTRASWLFSATMPAATSTKEKKKLPAAAQLRRQVVKRTAISKEKEGESKKKAKAKKEEEQNGAARVLKCKKNDGKRWHCNRPVSQPNTYCEYHSAQKRSYLHPDFVYHSAAELEETAPAPRQAATASKSSISNKSRKRKRIDFSATEGFYYYAGFGPFRSKRQFRSGGMNEPLPAKQEEEEEAPEDDALHPTEEAPEAAECTNQQAASQDGESSFDDDMAGIAGVDEESSDEDYDGTGIAGRNMDGKAANSIGEGKRKMPWKRWRKPVKARSLKSLM